MEMSSLGIYANPNGQTFQFREVQDSLAVN